jgi:lipopolysaccharide/colanic/teichoic acid biosynthesis glycosyltransferase
MTEQQYSEVYMELMVDKGHELVNLNDKKTFLLIKRGMDLMLGFFGLILATPIIVITMILISLESKGSPI